MINKKIFLLNINLLDLTKFKSTLRRPSLILIVRIRLCPWDLSIRKTTANISRTIVVETARAANFSRISKSNFFYCSIKYSLTSLSKISNDSNR
jgi:hypothetical protein